MKEYLKQRKEIIEKALYSYAEGKSCDYEIIYEAVGYSLKAGGKRLRPILTLAFCEGCGGDIKKAMPFACAIEMIHTYSLIHDDLPCMDDDDLRRGKPTSHKVYGEATAVLAGDALLNLAAETVTAYGRTAGLTDRQIVDGISVLYRNSGINGMIGGQVIDMMYEGKAMPPSLLYTLHSHKTGALIKAACHLGCVAADAGKQYFDAAEQFAENLGTAFQIQDDILDVIGDEAILGKPIHSDEQNNKTTFVTVYGVERAAEIAREKTELAKKAAQSFDNAKLLCELCDLLTERKS